MRILVLSTYFPPDISATGDQAEMACRRFVELGDEVTVVCAFPHYARRSLDPTYRGKLWEVVQQDGMRVVRVPVYANGWESKIHRAVNYLSVTATMGIGAALQQRPDVILTNCPPLTLGPVSDALALRWGVPWVYHVGDVWTAAMQTIATRMRTALTMTSNALERHVFRRADAITTVSAEITRTVLEMGPSADKVFTIDSSADTQTVMPRPRAGNPVAQRLGISDTFNVMFSGNIGFSQGLNHAVEAAAMMADEMPELRLVIVGSGTTRPDLEEMVRTRDIGNVVFADFVPREEFSDLLGAADVGLVPLLPGYAVHSTPSKIFTLMAAERPILASVDAESQTAKRVAEAGAGRVIPPADPAAYCQAFRELAAAPEERAVYGRSGRAAVLERHTGTAMGDQFRTVMAKVVEANAR